MLEKDDFFSYFHCEEAFERAKQRGISWNSIKSIGEDYEANHYMEYMLYVNEIINKLYKEIQKDNSIEDKLKIIYGRAKKPDHLVEKIIRKVGDEGVEKYEKLSLNNYMTEITDLIGVRILTLKREDWKTADKLIMNNFSLFNVEKEPPVAYVCYGDRDVYGGLIKTEYTNKGYRSQHYIILYKEVPCEIQVRTLAEEVYGDFDHAYRYPYNKDNRFLMRYNHIVSKAVSELDDLISTCAFIPKQELNNLGKSFEEDVYIDYYNDPEKGRKKSLFSSIEDDYPIEMDNKETMIRQERFSEGNDKMLDARELLTYATSNRGDL